MMSEQSPAVTVIFRKYQQADLAAVDDIRFRLEQELRQSPGFLNIRNNPPVAGSDGLFATVISFKSLDCPIPPNRLRQL